MYVDSSLLSAARQKQVQPINTVSSPHLLISNSEALALAAILLLIHGWVSEADNQPVNPCSIPGQPRQRVLRLYTFSACRRSLHAEVLFVGDPVLKYSL